MTTIPLTSSTEANITATKCPVWACNEWDPLEEVIVGTAINAAVPAETRAMTEATMPEKYWTFFQEHAGRLFPAELLVKAQEELDLLAETLENLGIVVRRPDDLDWVALKGNSAAMARDVLLVAADEILETPVAWKSRQKECWAYHSLLSEYAAGGARWESAPKPMDPEALIVADHRHSDREFISVINESHPVFDAADFLRFGKDIVGQRSHVTNQTGINWLRHHLGPAFNVHILNVNDTHPMHIDATIMPLRPGLMLVNRHRAPIAELAGGLFKDWEFLITPDPVAGDDPPFYFTSDWINMNVLSIDHRRVLVEERQVPMIRLLEKAGLEPIVLPFRHVNSLGGSFHCATLDIRRRGKLERYLADV